MTLSQITRADAERAKARLRKRSRIDLIRDRWRRIHPRPAEYAANAMGQLVAARGSKDLY